MAPAAGNRAGWLAIVSARSFDRYRDKDILDAYDHWRGVEDAIAVAAERALVDHSQRILSGTLGNARFGRKSGEWKTCEKAVSAAISQPQSTVGLSMRKGFFTFIDWMARKLINLATKDDSLETLREDHHADIDEIGRIHAAISWRQMQEGFANRDRDRLRGLRKLRVLRLREQGWTQLEIKQLENISHVTQKRWCDGFGDYVREQEAI